MDHYYSVAISKSTYVLLVSVKISSESYICHSVPADPVRTTFIDTIYEVSFKKGYTALKFRDIRSKGGTTVATLTAAAI